jgi:histidinol dehydrogenase
VYRIGGAQAVAALAYGTETDPTRRRDRRAGQRLRGHRQARGGGEGRVGVPSAFAGPSEVVVVADGASPVELAAVDIVVQAEHGPGGLAWLVTWDEATLDRRHGRGRAPRRCLAAAARPRGDPRSGGYAVLVDGPEQAMAVANAIAPEHLELMSAGAEALVPLVRHAGAVFCGRGRRRASATTWPVPPTCCPRSGRLGSGRRSPSPTSPSTSTW